MVGGRLLEELNKTTARNWTRQAILAGRITPENKTMVSGRTTELVNNQLCKSNDPHVIALAQISGARLLYSNDNTLQDDFQDKNLLDNPRGKVYTTLVNRHVTPAHESLLRRRNLCRMS